MRFLSALSGAMTGIICGVLIMDNKSFIAFCVFTAAILLVTLRGENQDPPTTVGSTTTQEEE